MPISILCVLPCLGASCLSFQVYLCSRRGNLCGWQGVVGAKLGAFPKTADNWTAFSVVLATERTALRPTYLEASS